MNKTLLRRLGIVVAILILVGGVFLMNNLSQQKEAPKRKAERKAPVRQVEIMQVQNRNVPTSLDIQGQLVAFNKIEIFTEVSGVLEASSRPFKEGSYFPKGSLLVRINSEEAQLSLLAQKSNLLNAITQMMPDLKIDYPQSFQHWETYLRNFDVEQPLPAFPEAINDQEKYFVSSRNLLSQYYSIKSIENRLKKYEIFAPFSGVLTEASINPGALVRVGQKLGELMSTGSYELEATVPVRDLKYLSSGNTVQLYSDDIEGKWTGRIKRISDQIDPGTQTVTIFIGVSGKRLREGMYLRGDVRSTSIKNAIKIHRDLIVNQNAIYIYQDSTIQLRPIEIAKVTADSIIVTGLENNLPIIAEKLTGAYEGMKVRVETPSTSDSRASPAKTTTALGN